MNSPELLRRLHVSSTAAVQTRRGQHGAPFTELPTGFRLLQEQMLPRPVGDREMVDILALVPHYDEQAVLTAVELTLAPQRSAASSNFFFR